jgi:hypothetical protein
MSISSSAGVSATEMEVSARDSSSGESFPEPSASISSNVRLRFGRFALGSRDAARKPLEIFSMMASSFLVRGASS